MAASYNFRSAFNGFNREDVVHYIEYINSKHTAQVNQLKSDLTAAQKENTALRARPQADPQLEEKIAELEARCAAAEEARSQLQAALAEVTAQRDTALQGQPQPKQHNEEELEAYRRAERMERQAKERADAMYQKANGVIADATAKVDEATDEIAGIADQVIAQLAVLQEAVNGSKKALSEAAATLYAIRPESEE